MKQDIDRIMQEKQIDAILVTGPAQHNPAMYYFTGGIHLTHGELLKVVGCEPKLYYSSSMEREEAARSGLDVQSTEVFNPRQLLEDAKGNVVLARAARYQKMLVEAGLSRGKLVVYGRQEAGSAYATLKALSKLLPELEIVSEESCPVLTLAQLTKSEDEIARIRQMAEITTEVVGLTADFLSSHRAKDHLLVKEDGTPLQIGEVKRQINIWLMERGAENPEGTVFALGREAGIPHSLGSDEMPLELGKTIVFDIFPCEMFGGYFYDFTRTWCLGYAPDDVWSVYQDVYDVYQLVTHELKAGTACSIYQKLTCDLFEQRGHETVQVNPQTEEGYVHSLGHGVGLNIHEKPWFGRNADEYDQLLPGVVFTIEPGLYYPSKGLGVRLENTYYVSPKGKIELFAPYSMELVLPVRK
ncbi:MAG: M24 family metallopeptidase [Chloroflexota bacterium]